MQAVQAEQCPNRWIIKTGKKKDLPPENGSRDPKRAQRVADVVLAITECTFAVLPCFPPMD